MSVKLGAAVLVAALLLASQLLLPVVAEQRLRDELRASGDVISVEVSAFPALQLLGKKADSVSVRLREAEVGGAGDLGDLLASTRRTDRLDARIDTLVIGPLRVRDVTLRKRGSSLTGTASLRSADLSAALPVDLGLRPVASGGGSLVLQADVGPVGVRARLSAQDGALVIAPDGLLGGIGTVTVFEDPRVQVTDVSASQQADGFTLRVRGSVT